MPSIRAGVFADGTIEVLGPFGANDSQPLRSVTAQTCIPKLFELASNSMGAKEPEPVKGYYRIDALEGPAVNLAHVTLGHRATLGWVVAATFVFRAATESPDQKNDGVFRRGMTANDHAVKYIMDPYVLFASLGD